MWRAVDASTGERDDCDFTAGPPSWRFRVVLLPESALVLAGFKMPLLVIAIFNIMWTWNDFMGPLIYLTDSKQYPLVMGLYAFQTRFGVQWHLLMAASLATTLPLIILFFIAQRYFIEGITLTGLKGV